MTSLPPPTLRTIQRAQHLKDAAKDLQHDPPASPGDGAGVPARESAGVPLSPAAAAAWQGRADVYQPGTLADNIRSRFRKARSLAAEKKGAAERAKKVEPWVGIHAKNVVLRTKNGCRCKYLKHK